MLKGFLETEIVFVAEAFGFLTQKRREGEELRVKPVN